MSRLTILLLTTLITLTIGSAQDQELACRSYEAPIKLSLSQVLVREFAAFVEIRDFDQGQKLLTVKGEKYLVGIVETSKTNPEYGSTYGKELSERRLVDLVSHKKKKEVTNDLVNNLIIDKQLCWDTGTSHVWMSLTKDTEQKFLTGADPDKIYGEGN